MIREYLYLSPNDRFIKVLEKIKHYISRYETIKGKMTATLREMNYYEPENSEGYFKQIEEEIVTEINKSKICVRKYFTQIFSTIKPIPHKPIKRKQKKKKKISMIDRLPIKSFVITDLIDIHTCWEQLSQIFKKYLITCEELISSSTDHDLESTNIASLNIIKRKIRDYDQLNQDFEILTQELKSVKHISPEELRGSLQKIHTLFHNNTLDIIEDNFLEIIKNIKLYDNPFIRKFQEQIESDKQQIDVLKHIVINKYGPILSPNVELEESDILTIIDKIVKHIIHLQNKQPPLVQQPVMCHRCHDFIKKYVNLFMITSIDYIVAETISQDLKMNVNPIQLVLYLQLKLLSYNFNKNLNDKKDIFHFLRIDESFMFKLYSKYVINVHEIFRSTGIIDIYNPYHLQIPKNINIEHVLPKKYNDCSKWKNNNYTNQCAHVLDPFNMVSSNINENLMRQTYDYIDEPDYYDLYIEKDKSQISPLLLGSVDDYIVSTKIYSSSILDLLPITIRDNYELLMRRSYIAYMDHLALQLKAKNEETHLLHVKKIDKFLENVKILFRKIEKHEDKKKFFVQVISDINKWYDDAIKIMKIIHDKKTDEIVYYQSHYKRLLLNQHINLYDTLNHLMDESITFTEYFDKFKIVSSRFVANHSELKKLMSKHMIGGGINIIFRDQTAYVYPTDPISRYILADILMYNHLIYGKDLDLNLYLDWKHTLVKPNITKDLSLLRQLLEQITSIPYNKICEMFEGLFHDVNDHSAHLRQNTDFELELTNMLTYYVEHQFPINASITSLFIGLWKLAGVKSTELQINPMAKIDLNVLRYYTQNTLYDPYISYRYDNKETTVQELINSMLEKIELHLGKPNFSTILSTQ